MKRSYLGTGINYPIVLDKGSVVLNSDTPLIDQSINIILSTAKGSRFFLPEFGSRLSELAFEPNDEVLAELLIYFITEALDAWENRIRVVSVNTVIDTDVVQCTITYRVLQSNEIESFVYPFYKKIKY